jgi:transcriptional regulator with XRE-family HTH domain
MTPRQIQIALRERKISQRSIAEELGVSEMAVSLIINRNGVSRRIMDTVAGKIGQSTQAVFPEYFGIDQSPDQTGNRKAA